MTLKRVNKSSPAKRIFLSPPHMGGEEARFVREAFESNYIAPLGPQVDAFERAFSEKTGIPFAVAVSSGTAAIHLALRNLTFIGSITPIIFQGGVPVFIDSDYTSWNLDPQLLLPGSSARPSRYRVYARSPLFPIDPLAYGYTDQPGGVRG